MAVVLHNLAILTGLRPVLNRTPIRRVTGRRLPRLASRVLPLLAVALMVTLGRGAIAQTQQMYTAYTGLGSIYTVASDAAGNIYFPLSGSIYQLPAGATSISLIPVAGSSGFYPFSNPVVAVNSDVSGDLFVAVQFPLTSTTGPYIQVYKFVKGSSGYTWGGLVYGPTNAPLLVNGSGFSTLNSMAYDNLNGLLYLNFLTGNDGIQNITCSPVPITFTGTTVLGTYTVLVSSTNGLVAGQIIRSNAIPVGDTIASVAAGEITLKVAATASASGTFMGVVTNSSCNTLTEFSSPMNDAYANGLAVDGAGNVYTSYNTSLSQGYIAQFAPGLSGNGKIYSTAFTGGFGTFGTIGSNPAVVSLAADDEGDILVDDGSQVLGYAPSFNSLGTPTGTFTPIAGTGTNGYNGDGTANLHQISASEGIALDPSGNLWIADTGNGMLREVATVAVGQGGGTGEITGGGAPAFGCLMCGPQTLGNGTGGAGGGGTSAPTDTIPTNHFSNLTLLNPATRKLYVAYPNALVVFNTTNDTVATTAGIVDYLPQQITQMVLNPKTNIIWAINSAGQVLEINSTTDLLVGGSPLTVATGAVALDLAVDTSLNQVYVGYQTTSSIFAFYHVAVISGSTGATTATLSLNGPPQAIVADSNHGLAYLIAQDPYSGCSGACAQYDYDMVVINGSTANNNRPIGITTTITLIRGSAYSSGITQSSLAVDPNTGKVVLADGVDSYTTIFIYNSTTPASSSYNPVYLGWVPNAVAIDTANSIAYVTDSQYNNVREFGLAAVLPNTTYAFTTTLFSGTQGGNSCGFLGNAVMPDPTTGQVYITTCVVTTTATPVLSLIQYNGYTVNGSTLTPSFTTLDSVNLPLSSTQSFGGYSYGYALNVDTSDHAVFLGNSEAQNILVFNGPYPTPARPQIVLGNFLAYNPTAVFTQRLQTLVVTNNGTGAMLAPQLAVSGTNQADFTLFSNGCSGGVAPAGQCNDVVSFIPSILGSESATGLLIDDSPDVPQSISLSGTGVLPAGLGAAPSTTLLQASSLLVAPGASLSLYATISPAVPSTDQVLFLNNNTSPATVLGTGVYQGSSVWKLTTTSLAAGTYSLTAYYAGDNTYAPSTSGTLTVAVSTTGSQPTQPQLSLTPGEFYVSNPQTGTNNFSAIALDAAGDEFVLDSGIGTVTEYPLSGSQTGFVVQGFGASGPYDQGSLMNHPMGIAVAPDGGTVYIADTQNGGIATAASAGTTYLTPLGVYTSCNGFGPPMSQVTFSSPTGIAIGPPATPATVPNGSTVIPNTAGYDLYVADSGNKRILQINPVGAASSQCGYYIGGVLDAILAGTGSPSGPALNYPTGVAATGTLGSVTVYIADAPPAITNTSHGNGTIYKNGVALANASIVFPYSLAADAAGDVYFSDQSLSQVWRIDTSGNFLLEAGNGVNSVGASCTTAAPCEATQTNLLTPYGLGISGNGSIFAGDTVATGQVGEVNVTTGLVNFASQPTSIPSSAVTITVTDTASVPVGASGVTTPGTNSSDFAITGGTCSTSSFTLQPGTSCTILVTFTPGATGARSGEIDLTVQGEIYGGSIQKILLTGNGVTGPTPQTITFPPPVRPDVYGSAGVALAATASSGQPVTYSLVPGSPAVISGNIVSFTGAGLVRIDASQSGNTQYAAASTVEQDITVLPAPLVVSAQPASRTYDSPDPAFVDSITGFVPPDTFASIVTGAPSFSVALDLGTTPANTALTVTPTLGTLSLNSPNYVFTLSPSTLTVVCCEPQSIAPGSLPPANFPLPVGTPFSLSVVSTSGLPVTYSIISGPGSLSANPSGGEILTATSTGLITVQATAAGNSNISAATAVTLTFLGQ